MMALVVLASYLVGAIPFGYLVARGRGVNILQQGSGNIGATNVGRVLGRRFGMLVFLLDFSKGALPVAAAQQAPAAWSEGLPPSTLPVLAGIFAFLGHLFPIYLRFRGGKGVATATGVVSVLAPAATLAALVLWLALLAGTRYVSLASLAAAAALCGLRLLSPQPWSWEHRVVTLFCLTAAGLVFLRHQANIRRLLEGTENRFPETATMNILARTLHVVSVGLWFGTVIFFLLVGAVAFRHFEAIAALPAEERPVWLPVWAGYDGPVDNDRLAQPLRKEQGNRVAGAVVSPLFAPYFAIQAGCGLVATLTALAWWPARGRIHRLRLLLLVLALVSVAGGWLVEQRVDHLIQDRHQTFDALLSASPPTSEQVQQAAGARAVFAAWHGYSMMLNLLTILLVTGAMILAAQLPSRTVESAPVRLAQAPATDAAAPLVHQPTPAPF
jgi:acyl-phosphate glycerol 3-phosphate acyltransferase